MGRSPSPSPLGTVEPLLLNTIEVAGALLVQLPDDLREGRERVIAVVDALREQGALAVRLEQSKLGWAIDRWLALVRPGDPFALHRCAVTMLVGSERVVSCGMHAFSLPDASVEMGSMTSEGAQELLSTLNVYQLAEDPLLLSGQTFSPTPGAARRVVQRWPDDGYPPDHWCHNPYGLWRLSHSELMDAALIRAGVKRAFLSIKGGGHFAPYPTDGVDPFRETVQWFDKHLRMR
jgi:hypothetical protein